MALGLQRHLVVFSLVAYVSSLTLFPLAAAAIPQNPSSVYFPPGGVTDPGQIADLAELQFGSVTVEIRVKDPAGSAVQRPAVVTLTRPTGQFYGRETTKAGFTKFDHVPAGEFTVQVIAPGYEGAEKKFEVPTHAGGVTIEVEVKPLSAEDAASAVGFYALPPKAQKDVGKALQALRANKPNDALHPLQAAQKTAPNSAEVEYLLGLYSSQVKDEAQARMHWTKTLALNPKHLGALLAVGNDLLQEKKSAEALPYLRRAVEAEPASWRAHILLAEGLLLDKQSGEAIKESQRAMDLGHERAATAQLVLAHAFVAHGDRDRAIQALEGYLKIDPSDAAAAKDLATLKDPAVNITADGADNAGDLNKAAADAAALPVATNWLPADIDDHMPAVEPGVACDVDGAVRKAGQELMKLAQDVDRFTATETLTHQSIDKYGLPSAPEKRTFSYVASIEEVNHRFLNVEEYRLDKNGGPAQFPGGVATNGLPALVLIFHPFNAPDFTMACEGLARLSTGLAWQVHFKQRPDKPNVIKRYRIGADGPSYPVALKGRVWISADKYQIVRLETDLVAPIKPIRLAADRAEIEYGPVEFAKGKVSMWLPKTADVYYDWKGQRIHRRHSFTDYMLFAIDDKQKISVPKVDDSTADSASAAPNKKP